MPLGGHFGIEEDGRDRAGWLASCAIRADGGVYVHLFFIGPTLNAVNRTNVDARQFFCADAGLTDHVGQTSRSASSILVPVCVDLGEVLPLLGEIVFGEDRLDRASWFASSAVDAFVGMDVEQFRGLELGFVLARMNAIYRADVYASRVLGPYAGFSDNVRH